MQANRATKRENRGDATGIADHGARLIAACLMSIHKAVRQQPGDKSPMHSHPHHAVYWLTGSTLKFTSSDGKTKTVTTKPGQVVWRNPETHTVEIVGKTASHALDIELKK